MRSWWMAPVLGLSMAAPAAALTGHLVHDNWEIPAQGAQFQAFTLGEARVLSIEVHGVRHAKKGFRVRLVDGDDLLGCRVRGGPCRERWRRPGLHELALREALPPGRWAVFVENNENWFWPAIIHIDLHFE